jgi:hypothetical protein
MAGSIYVVNVTGEDLELAINGMQAPCGRIAGWERYRPNLAAVPRSRYPEPGSFCNGPNAVDLVRTASRSTANVPIDGQRLPINQDLLLLVQRDRWELVTDFGMTVDTGEVRDVF